jgi:hypothetical protein
MICLSLGIIFQIGHCSNREHRNCCGISIGDRLRKIFGKSNNSSKIVAEDQECKICFTNYTKGVKKYFNNNAIKKVLPCCNQDWCEKCRFEWLQKEPQSLEILLKDPNTCQNLQLKCMRCPFSCMLIPHDEKYNTLLEVIKNHSIKLHEQIQLLKEAELTTSRIIIDQIERDGFWQILLNNFMREEPELANKVELVSSLNFLQNWFFTLDICDEYY